jgi:dihydrodipicolinate synthase/N-acetylneuraminate lyase
MKVNWKGVYPAITTKFTDKDELDLLMFEKNILFQVEAGVDGIILGGTLGEATTLTDKEKDQLTATTLKIVEGKIPVIVNIAEQTTKEAVRQAQRAEANGANGLMMLPPMNYKATDQETVEYFKAIANATALALQNSLGMICDPITKRVEAPCLGKNVMAASNALSCANMALANYDH